MWVVTGILATGSLITIIEAPYLVRKRMIKELCIFAVILFIGMTLSILQVLRIPLPNPLDWITAMIKPISDAVLGMLK